MKKKIFIYFLCISFLNSTYLATSAKWYGNFEQTINLWSGIQNCLPDAEIDIINPSFEGDETPLRWGLTWSTLDKNAIGQGYYSLQARAIYNNGETFTCQKWDATKPESKTISYGNGEISQSIVSVSLWAADRWGSGLKKYEIQYSESTEDGGFSNWSSWKNAGILESKDLNVTFGFVVPDTQNELYAFKFRFRNIDVAGNEGEWKEASADSIIKVRWSKNGWYGRHTENFDWKSTKWSQTLIDAANHSFCDEDIHQDGKIMGVNIPSTVPTSSTTRSPSAFWGVPLQWGIVNTEKTYDGNEGNGYYVRQSRVISQIPVTGKPDKMQCEMWDGTDPWAKEINYFDGWTKNRNIEISIKSGDYGWSFSSPLQINLTWNDVRLKVEWENLIVSNRSGINAPKLEIPTTGNIPYNIGVPHVIIQKKTANNPVAYDNWSDWEEITTFSDIQLSTINSEELVAKYTFIAPTTSWTAYKFRYKVIDGAGNASEWKEWTQVLKLDTELPKIQNIGVQVFDPNNPWSDDTDNSGDIPTLNDNNNNFMAGEDSPIEVVYNNQDGSPIKIYYEIEKDDPANSFENHISDDFKNRFRLPHTYVNVDNDLSSRNTGGRDISLRITKIVDAAGNELTINEPPYIFNVFANILRDKVTSLAPSGNFIADGQDNWYGQEIKDIYGNKIVPAPSIGRKLSRETKVISNTMYLNQKARTGDTSVLVDGVELPFNTTQPQIPVSSTLPDSSTANYRFKIQVYTPTANAYDSDDGKSDPNAQFSLRSSVIVEDDQAYIRSIATKTFTELVVENQKYLPLFTNKFSGNIEDGWFIEWVNQNSNLMITRNANSGIINIIPDTSMEYNGVDADKFTLTINGNKIFNKNAYQSVGQGSINPLNTFLKQLWDQITDASKIYLSTHFVYTLDGKNITYNGDIIGKVQYHDNSEQNDAKQVGVKIIGNSVKNNFYQILEWQNQDIGNNISTFNIPSIRNEIFKSIAIATRNIPLRSSGMIVENFENIPSGNGIQAWIVKYSMDSSILLIEANGQNIELGGVAPFGISGKRTIVVRGGNVYIKNNMYYSSDSILGVVVQKDASGRWWNLYIHPDITNVVGVYVLDGSVISYNGSEITQGDINTLKNQLYIYGSILSHNTIGGSRKNPVLCPIFVTTCTDVESQKYDLNYLRRYYLYKWQPFGGVATKLIGGGNISNISWDPLLQKKYNNISDDLAKYPIIIEYDKRLLVNPPVGFESYRE